MAARRGHLACVQALLEGGSATNATNKEGYTALHHAANDGHFTCVTALVSAGERDERVHRMVFTDRLLHYPTYEHVHVPSSAIMKVTVCMHTAFSYEPML